MALHPKQQEILKILAGNQDDPLTLKEIQEQTGLSSPSHVHHHIQQLEKQGYLRRNPNNPKDYQVILEPQATIVFLNLYGQATCGPSGTMLSGNPIETIPVHKKFIPFNANEAFLMEAVGKSMEPKIHERDIIIANKNQSPKNGDIIICTWDDEVRIKVFRKIKEEYILLESLNKDFEPIVVKEGSFQIEGVMRGIITKRV